MLLEEFELRLSFLTLCQQKPAHIHAVHECYEADCSQKNCKNDNALRFGL